LGGAGSEVKVADIGHRRVRRSRVTRIDIFYKLLQYVVASLFQNVSYMFGYMQGYLIIKAVTYKGSL